MDCKLSHQGHPEDIFPLVLTSTTQELFGCTADQDVTGESPYKLLQKDDIIQDIKRRATVSDFSPVKKIVLVRLTHCCRDHWDNTPKTLDDEQTPSLRLWEQTSNQFNLNSHFVCGLYGNCSFIN